MIFVTALVILVVPYPGSLSVQITRVVSGAMAGGFGVGLLSEVPLILLAAGVVMALGVAWGTRAPQRLVATVTAAAVPVAYVMSEGIKLAVAQPRPCAVWEVAGECAPAGDWSFPSNHATVAFGAVVVIAVATRSALLTACAALAAIVVAFGRLAEGAHYLHDVATAAVLASLVVGGVALLAHRLARGSARDTPDRRA